MIRICEECPYHNEDVPVNHKTCKFNFDACRLDDKQLLDLAMLHLEISNIMGFQVDDVAEINPALMSYPYKLLLESKKNMYLAMINTFKSKHLI